MTNENNQPQSQQTKREPGYYWVKMEGFQWRIAGWNGSEWTVPGSLSVFGDDWFEIDERRIERSHSPTEQPGDAKHTWKVGGTNETDSVGPGFSTAIFDEHGVFVARSFGYTYHESIELAKTIVAQAAELEQLRSELDKLKSDCDAWKGMIAPILDFCQQHGKSLGIRPGEFIPEKVLEILKSALSGGSK